MKVFQRTSPSKNQQQQIFQLEKPDFNRLITSYPKTMLSNYYQSHKPGLYFQENIKINKIRYTFLNQATRKLMFRFFSTRFLKRSKCRYSFCKRFFRNTNTERLFNKVKVQPMQVGKISEKTQSSPISKILTLVLLYLSFVGIPESNMPDKPKLSNELIAQPYLKATISVRVIWKNLVSFIEKINKAIEMSDEEQQDVVDKFVKFFDQFYYQL